MSEAGYEIDDVVRANIEGRLIEVRRNGQGEQVVVEYYDNEGDLRRRGPPPGRKFKPGDWVKTTGGDVGIVFHDDGDREDSDPYRVGTVADGDVSFYSANELVPHLPS